MGNLVMALHIYLDHAEMGLDLLRARETIQITCLWLQAIRHLGPPI